MIPNVHHFVYIASGRENHPFGLVHYLALKSTHDVNRPDSIILHCNREPEGPWWELARSLATVSRVEPPAEVFGNSLVHPAHQADVLRLQILQETGGVYLDMDTICVKPLREFHSLRFALGQQFAVPHYYRMERKLRASLRRASLAPFRKPRIHGLCNAVLFAEKASVFGRIWLETYKTFRSSGRDDYWDEHSVQMPLRLARTHPELLTILSPYCFHYPLWDDEGLSMLFETARPFPKAYVHHLWQGNSWDRYLADLTVERLMTEDSTYSRIARRYLRDIPRRHRPMAETARTSLDRAPETRRSAASPFPAP